MKEQAEQGGIQKTGIQHRDNSHIRRSVITPSDYYRWAKVAFEHHTQLAQYRDSTMVKEEKNLACTALSQYSYMCS